MIHPLEVQKEVKRRLEALRVPVTEEIIHECYRAVLWDALEGARYALRQLQLEIDDYRAKHPEQGWTMQTKEQRERFHAHVFSLSKSL